MSGFLDLIRIRWDAPFRFAASALVLAGLVGLFIRTGPLLTLSGAAGWAGVDVIQTWLTAAHRWLGERSGVVAVAGLAVVLVGLATAYFRGRGASSAMTGFAASMEVGSWTPLIALGILTACWISVRIYDLVSDDSESWRLLSGMNRIVTSLSAAGFYAIALPFSWAFVRA